MCQISFENYCANTCVFPLFKLVSPWFLPHYKCRALVMVTATPFLQLLQKEAKWTCHNLLCPNWIWCHSSIVLHSFMDEHLHGIQELECCGTSVWWRLPSVMKCRVTKRPFLNVNDLLWRRFNPLNPELNPICYLLALLGVHHFLHVSRIRVKILTFRQLMSYIYGAPILDVSRSHTTTQHSR